MEENKEIQIRLIEINEISFYLNPIPLPIEQVEFGKNLNLEIGFRFDVNQETNIFKFYTLIDYRVLENAEPIVGIETELVFEISNLSSVVSFESGEQLKIDNNILATLAGVCIGTTRGLLASNTKGSSISKFPLPILNPTEILENMNKQQEVTK